MRVCHIGDRVTFFGRTYYVRGFSPMGVPQRSMHLEDAETREEIDAAVDELARGPVPGRQPADAS
jgi:hypothetical protein